MLVPGVGPEGQARIARATARVDGVGLSYEIASRYASGAGFARVEPSGAPALFESSVLELDAPRAVLAGSRSALAAIRRTVGTP
jgi:hypothetical protein